MCSVRDNFYWVWCMCLFETLTLCMCRREISMERWLFSHFCYICHPWYIVLDHLSDYSYLMVYKKAIKLLHNVNMVLNLQYYEFKQCITMLCPAPSKLYYIDIGYFQTCSSNTSIWAIIEDYISSSTSWQFDQVASVTV